MTDPTDESDDRTPRPRANGRRAADLLEDRVRKLESAVTELQSTQLTEEVVTDRVIARLGEMAGGPRPLSAANGVFLDDAEEVGEALVPVAPEPVIPKPPSGAVLQPPVPADPTRRKWFLVQLWDEIRLTARMYFDSRYRVSRTAQFAIPAFFVLYLLNYFLFSLWFSIPILSPVLERVVCILLAVFLYKVLARELVRYREAVEYLNTYGYR